MPAVSTVARGFEHGAVSSEVKNGVKRTFVELLMGCGSVQQMQFKC